MFNIDRRRLKSQEEIKMAFLELISEKHFDDITMSDISDMANVSRSTIYSNYSDKFDLLDHLIKEHMDEMRELYETASEIDFFEANKVWFEYIKDHYLFFSTMLASNGPDYFCTHFCKFLEEEFKNILNVNVGKNRGINEEIILQFVMSSYFGIVEWWVKNKMPYSPYVMAEQVGILMERNL